MTGEIDTKLYRNISLDELVTYAICCLNEEGVEATFENIVARSFQLFPDKFALVGYPQWPDSSRVNKAWLRCRADFKYINGSVKSGFQLTSKGYEAVEKVQNKIKSPFRHRANVERLASEERTREETFINQIEKSDVFKRYRKKGEKFDMSEYELCDLLFCTLESSLNVRQKKLNLLKGYAERLNRQTILEFLEFCEFEYRSYLRGNQKNENIAFRGGMFKQKIKGRKKK